MLDDDTKRLVDEVAEVAGNVGGGEIMERPVHEREITAHSIAAGARSALCASSPRWRSGTSVRRATERLTALAFGGGVAAAVFGFAMPGPDMAAAIADDADLSDAAAVAIRLMSDVFFLGAEMSAAVLLAATGVHALRTGSLPRWLAWVSLVVALALIILPIGWAALLFAFPLWVIVVSYLLWSASPDTPAATAAATTTP
jgi:hypothetical protein